MLTLLPSEAEEQALFAAEQIHTMGVDAGLEAAAAMAEDMATKYRARSLARDALLELASHLRERKAAR